LRTDSGPYNKSDLSAPEAMVLAEVHAAAESDVELDITIITQGDHSIITEVDPSSADTHANNIEN
jgi:hypothetical protein